MGDGLLVVRVITDDHQGGNAERIGIICSFWSARSCFPRRMVSMQQICQQGAFPVMDDEFDCWGQKSEAIDVICAEAPRKVTDLRASTAWRAEHRTPRETDLKGQGDAQRLLL